MVPGHVPAVVPALKSLGELPGTQRLQLSISLPLRNAARLNELLRQLYDPTSPRYRKYLSVDEFTRQFGPTQADYDAVAAFAQAHRLTVTQRYGNRVVLDVDGAVSDIESALHVSLREYRHPTEARNFYAPDREPALDLAVSVDHIGGLNNYALPKPSVRVKPALQAAMVRPLSGTGPSGEYMGNDFRAAYMPGVTLTGSGQVVGLLQYDGYSSSDITYYESEAGLPSVPLTNILISHFNGQGSGGDGQIEVSLDIEMAISMAPGLSKIIVYEGGSNASWDSMLGRIASDNSAKQISCSWSSPGMKKESTADNLFKEMAAQGQSFYCASGDTDADTGLIAFPEDSPYITQVGGTTLTVNGSGGPWNAETVWNWGGGTGSSGGINTQYTIPTWQQGTPMSANGGSTTMRDVPDVALIADKIYVRALNANQDVGGTSCAAPLWGALNSLVNQQAAANGFSNVGFINPSVYEIGAGSDYGSIFHDITTGNNISTTSSNAFYAATGYDLCTGMGTPNGMPLINALALGVDGLQVSFASLISEGPNGGAFSPTSTSVTLVNGTNAALSWSAGATQSWLTLSATAGALAASATTSFTVSINANAYALTSGTYFDTISVTDLNTGYVQTRPVSLTVIPSPVITSATAITTSSGSALSYQIVATNNPTSYTATGLPSGLSVSATSGLISGTVTSVGTSNISLGAINLDGTGTATLALTVLPLPPVITSATSATAITGEPFAYQIVATNNPASYSESNLPAGLSLNTSTGFISGAATTTGTGTVQINAANAGGTGAASIAFTVESPYQAWQTSTFTSAQLADPTVSGDLATPAGDGIPNLLKYALNLSPWVDGVGGLPVGGVVVTVSGTYLTLTYTQVLSATDITYLPQVSADSQTWASGPSSVIITGTTANPGGTTQTVTAQSATPVTGGAQFMRLEVTKP
jgi:subtilase family serine protease